MPLAEVEPLIFARNAACPASFSTGGLKEKELKKPLNPSPTAGAGSIRRAKAINDAGPLLRKTPESDELPLIVAKNAVCPALFKTGLFIPASVPPPCVDDVGAA
jgi:hypothetical protein